MAPGVPSFRRRDDGLREKERRAADGLSLFFFIEVRMSSSSMLRGTLFRDKVARSVEDSIG